MKGKVVTLVIGVLALLLFANVAMAFSPRDYFVSGVEYQNDGDDRIAKVFVSWGDGSHKKFIALGESSCLSPNSRYIAYVYEGNIYVRDKNHGWKVINTFVGNYPALTNEEVYYMLYVGDQQKIWHRPIKGGEASRLTNTPSEVAETEPAAGKGRVVWQTNIYESFDPYVYLTSIESYDISSKTFSTIVSGRYWWEVNEDRTYEMGEMVYGVDVSPDGGKVAYMVYIGLMNLYIVGGDDYWIYSAYTPTLLGNEGLYYFSWENSRYEIMDGETNVSVPSKISFDVTDAVLRKR